MKSIVLKVLPLAFAGSLLSAPAHAKKDKDQESVQVEPGAVEVIGIASFDEAFAQVTAIHVALDRAQLQLAVASGRIAAAVGLDREALVTEALGTLADRAEGKIEVSMSGAAPVLSPSDAVPEDIATAVEAVNAAIDEVAQAAASVAALSENTNLLIAQVQDFQTQLTPALLKGAGIESTALPRITRLTKADVQVTLETPARISAVSEELARFMDTVKDFGAQGSTGL